MTQVALPSGAVIDFGDMEGQEIDTALARIREEQPEMFEEAEDNQETGSLESVISDFRSRTSSPGTDRDDDPNFVRPTHDGEIEDISFRTWLGRADTAEEKAGRLAQVFGEGAFSRDNQGYFILDLDQVNTEQKRELGLPESGSIYVNKPGFTRYDIADFLGHEGVPLVASLGAGIAATGVGTAAGIGLMALAGGLGKAADEFLIEDVFEGLQKQTNEEVIRDSLLEAAFVGAGEGIGRGIGAGIKYAVKGPGAVPDPEIVGRIQKVYEESGMSPGQAKKSAITAAKEEQAATMRQMVDEGASIPAQTLTGKSILGRTQAIYESIFPNEKIAIENAQYVKDILQRQRDGLLTDIEAQEQVARKLQPIVDELKDRMVNPKTAYKEAQTALDVILKGQFKGLEEAFEAAPDLSAREFMKTLDPAVNLFNIHSRNLYQLAEEEIKRGGKDARLSLNNLKELLNKQGAGNEAVATAGEELTAREIGKASLSEIANKPVFDLIKNFDSVGISEVPALKAAIRATASDPQIQGAQADNLVANLIKQLDDEMDLKVLTLSADDPSSAVKTGIERIKQANGYYAEGMKAINSGLMNSVKKQIEGGYIQDMKGVVNTVVRNNEPNLLKEFLSALKPTSALNSKLLAVRQGDRPNLLSEAADLVEQGQVRQANDLLAGADLIVDKITKETRDQGILRMSEVVEGLPATDATRMSLLTDYAKVLRDYDNLAKRNMDPDLFQKEFRERVAGTWIHLNSGKADGAPNLPALADKFDKLGQKLQKELFGDQYDETRRLMSEFSLLGHSADDLATAAQRATAPDSSAGLSDALDLFSDRMARVKLQGEEAFLKAVGKENFDPEALVDHVLKNPRAVPRLKAEGVDLEDVKDGVVARLLPPDITSEIENAIQTGKFGQVLKQNLAEANKNGVVTDLLGKEFVENIDKIGDTGKIISASVLKGKPGLAAAGYAAAFGTSLLLSPVATLTGAASIYAISRLLRQPAVMKVLTNPRLRAYEAEKALAGGARLGDRNLVAEKAWENARRAVRTTVLQLGGYSAGEGTEVLRDTAAPILEEAIQEAAPVIDEVRESAQGLSLPDTTPQASLFQQPRPMAPGLTAAEGLRRVEMDKLLGIA